MVEFANVTSSSVSVTPANIKMVDQNGDTYTIEPVVPVCYDTIDIYAAQTLPPHGHLDVQLCYPAGAIGTLPQTLKGTGSLTGRTLSVPQASVVGTWGGGE